MKIPYPIRKILLKFGYSYWWRNLDNVYIPEGDVYKLSPLKQLLFRRHLYKTASRYYRARVPLCCITVAGDLDEPEVVSIYRYEEDVANMLQCLEQKQPLPAHLEVVYLFTYMTGRFNLLGRMCYSILEAADIANAVLSTAKYNGGNL